MLVEDQFCLNSSAALEVELKRVLIVKGNGLLSSALECLLSAEAGLSLECVTLGSPESLNGKIKSFNPDVLVLDASVPVFGHCSLRDLLVIFPNLPFIMVSSSENVLRVYTPQELSVKRAADLADLVRDI